MIISAVEHESVLETAHDLEKNGVEVIYLPVDRRGVVDLKKLETALNGYTVLVSVIYANNEIGVIQPISEIAEVIREFRKKKIENRSKNSTFYFLNSSFYPIFHTDAAQAFQFLDCDVNKLGVDMMTLSSHKIYGPKGAGALYVRGMGNATGKVEKKSSMSRVANYLSPILTGGGQEFGLRSGTENVPAIIGFARATELIFSNSRELENRRIARLRNYFWHELRKIYPKAEINGAATRKTRISSELSEKKHSWHSDKFVDSDRLPNILNIHFPGYKSEDLLMKFDLAGLAVSAGSACRSRAIGGSYVIEALGFSEERAKRSIRFSFGRPTTEMEVKKALAIVRRCLKN